MKYVNEFFNILYIMHLHNFYYFQINFIPIFTCCMTTYLYKYKLIYL